MKSASNATARPDTSTVATSCVEYTSRFAPSPGPTQSSSRP